MTSCKACVRERNKFLFILHKFNTNYPSVPIQMSKARDNKDYQDLLPALWDHRSSSELFLTSSKMSNKSSGRGNRNY